MRGIHRFPVNSPHKGQWLVTLIFSLICARINCWVNNHEAADLRRHRAHYDVIVMLNEYHHLATTKRRARAQCIFHRIKCTRLHIRNAIFGNTSLAGSARFIHEHAAYIYAYIFQMKSFASGEAIWRQWSWLSCAHQWLVTCAAPKHYINQIPTIC